MVVTAGFWNSHVHLLLPGLLHQEKVSSEQLTSQLNEMLTRWGFTTVFDIASELNNTNSIRDRITRGSVTGPRILTTGEPFWVKGGTPFYVRDFLLENNIHIPEVISLDEAENRVDSQIRNAADGIKIFINSLERDTILNMPLTMVKGISSRAHMHGKPVFAHVSTQMGIETALQGGVDILAHTTPMDGPWPDSLVRQMIAAKAALTPTLTLWIEETKKANLSPEELEKGMQLAASQLSAFHRLGGRVLFGTDVGYILHFNTLEEFIWISKAGLGFREILATLTTNPAKQFHSEERSGQIKPGFEADLTILEEDPANKVSAFSNVRYTIRSGKIIYQSK
jgi:imidazolonepropionase-like amidohydrolase